MQSDQEESQCTLHWQQSVLKTLKSLPSTTTPDCCIIVGTEGILTHKTALQLNSALLTAGDVGYNKQSDLIEIDLLPEFSENFDLVSDIVNSFYTGNLEVEEENFKIAYKFAKCYSAQWIMDYLRPMFVDYVKEDEGCERFIEVLKFAESIWCTDLAEACCEVLDSELMKKISDPEMISLVDTFTVRSLTSSDKLKIPEKDVFNLVVNWINASPSSSSQDLSDILENIQYHLIESDFLLDVVFDFVLNQQNIRDATRKSILMRVKGSMKQSNKQNSRSTLVVGRPTPRKDENKVSPDIEDCFRKIELWVKGERNENGHPIKISQEEVKWVISEKFKLMARNDQNVFVMYLSSNKEIALSFIDQLLLLHNIFPSPLLIRLVLDLCIHSDGQDYQRLNKIPWNLVSYQTISLIVTRSTVLEELLEFDCRNEYKRHRDFDFRSYSTYSERFAGCGQIELIMLWSLANRTQVNHIKQLITAVCFRKIPKAYFARILLPCIRIVFPDTNELKCAHAHKENEAAPSIMPMRIERMPNKTYQMQMEEYSHCFAGDSNDTFYEFKFTPGNDPLSLSLQSHDKNKGRLNGSRIYHELELVRSRNHSFILYDESTPHLPFYPLFIRNSDFLTIKNIVQCSTNFRCMFYKRLD